MGSIFRINRKLYLKVKALDGSWKQIATGNDDTADGRAAAEHMLHELENKLAAQRAADELVTRLGGKPRALTVREYANVWLDARKTATVDDDRGRLENHILPVIGHIRLPDLRPRHIRELIKGLEGKKKLGNRRADGTRVVTDELIAPRTVRHCYATLHAMLADAVAAERIPSNPCVLKDELPEKKDKDRTWRRTAVFALDEVELIISSELVPEDRRVLYALMFLGAMRFGEAAALTWRDYDPTATPLGKLVVEKSYSTKSRTVKATKTDNPREMPCHATLAKMLAAWKLGGFERLTGRKPQPGDLIVPSRTGTHRNANHMLRRFHEDLERLGLRERRQHDARRTFISIARAHGARPDILRWVTHGPTGDITDVYTTLPWATLCEEVAKARIELREGKVIELSIAVGGGPSDKIVSATHFGEALVKPSNVLLSLVKEGGADGTRTWQSQSEMINNLATLQ